MKNENTAKKKKKKQYALILVVSRLDNFVPYSASCNLSEKNIPVVKN